MRRENLIKKNTHIFFKATLIAVTFVLLFTSCAPKQTPAPTAIPATPTHQATETVKPTDTPSPSPSPTSIPPTSTSTPIPPTATPIPGPELLEYLPGAQELPKCLWITTWIHLDGAGIFCHLAGNIGLNVSVSLLYQPVKPEDMKLNSAYKSIPIDKIGDSSIAGISASGKEAQLTSIKGNASIGIYMFNPNGKVNIDTAIEAAKITSQKITSEIIPPIQLTFPENLQKDKLTTYFSQIKMSFVLYENSQQKETSEFTEKSVICLNFNPVKRSRDSMAAAIYDVQKKQIISKFSYEMYPQKSCGGLEPRYPKGKYQTAINMNFASQLEKT